MDEQDIVKMGPQIDTQTGLFFSGITEFINKWGISVVSCINRRSWDEKVAKEVEEKEEKREGEGENEAAGMVNPSSDRHIGRNRDIKCYDCDYFLKLVTRSYMNYDKIGENIETL